MFVRTYASSRVKRKSFYRKSKLQMFLISRGHTTFTRGPKRYTNSVLSRVGKSAIFVLNRVRVWVAEPHLRTPRIYRVPPPPGCKATESGKKVNTFTLRGGICAQKFSLKSRLFTVPFFFVWSFRYTASYRHGYLDFQMYRGAGVGDYSSDRGEGE